MTCRSANKTGKIWKKGGGEKIDKKRSPVKGAIPDTFWTYWYVKDRMIVL